MTSVAGATAGKTKITVSPAKIVQSNKYKYKLQASDFATLPELGDDLSAWTDWNGTDEITATNGYYIAVAETEANYTCEKVGKKQVVSRIESTITYMDGESAITGLTPTTYLEGIGATLPTEVTKEGYTFAGWYANAELTGDVVTEIGTSATGNKTFYAKFTQNGEVYTDAINNIELTINTNAQTGVKTFVLDNNGTEITGIAKSSVPTEVGVNTEYFLEYEVDNAPKFGLARISGTGSYTITIISNASIYQEGTYANDTKTYKPLTATTGQNGDVLAVSAITSATSNKLLFDSTATPLANINITPTSSEKYVIALNNYGVANVVAYNGTQQAMEANVTVTSTGVGQLVALSAQQAGSSTYVFLWNTSTYDVNSGFENAPFTRVDSTISDPNKLAGTVDTVMDGDNGYFVFTYNDSTEDRFLYTPVAENFAIYVHVE